MMFNRKLKGMAIAIAISTILVGCGEEQNPVSKQISAPAPAIKSNPVTMSKDDAAEKLNQMVGYINPRTAVTGRRAKNVSFERADDLSKLIPAIDEMPITVDGSDGQGYTNIEIMASSEKAGNNYDGWMVKVVQDFNRKQFKLSDGTIASIDLRKVPSGMQYMYLASKKHVPEAITPSNELWVNMAKSRGVMLTQEDNSLVQNHAGIVIKNDSYLSVKEKYGSVDVSTIVDATIQGDIVMGYTNPYTSSTGLNFLVNVLHHLSSGDETKMTSDEVVSSLVKFQEGVPAVQMNTMQIRDGIAKSGSLDAFVMEYQSYIKTPDLNNGIYKFVPFGVRHDNPLYSVNNAVDGTEQEVIDRFVKFAKTDNYTNLAKDYGFNSNVSWNDAYQITDNSVLLKSQKVWKTNKNAGRPVVAVFVADRSGSMSGSRIMGVKNALVSAADFIKPDNYIGLVTFSNTVQIPMEINNFNLNKKAEFVAASQDIQTGGGTAMYNGVMVGLKMLNDKMAEVPNAKPILFVLTDGETDQGYNFEAVNGVVKGLGIPVYTIGYEANISELARLASVVEAANINANQGKVEFQLSALLNAQM